MFLKIRPDRCFWLLLGLVSLGAVLALGMVWGGVLNRFAADGSTDTGLIARAILCYWVLLLGVALFLRFCVRRPRKALLMVIAIAVSVGVLELALRIVMPPLTLARFIGIRSARFHHALAPSVDMFHGVIDGVPVTVHTNEDGFRSPYSRTAFRARGTRIVALGDSFTFGWGVPTEQAWPQRLELSLRERYPGADVGVLNAGIIGYSPYIERYVLDEVLSEYAPQVLVLMVDATDFGDDHGYAQEEALHRGTPHRFGHPDGAPPEAHGALWTITTAQRAALTECLAWPFRFVSRHVLGRVYEREDYYTFSVDIGGVEELNRFFIYRHPPSETRPYFAATGRHIEAIRARCAALGAELLLVPVPRYHHWDDSACPDNWEGEEYGTDEAHEFAYLDFLRAFAATNGIDSVDLLPAHQAAGVPLVFDADPHWNAAGNALVAEQLGAAIAERYAQRLGWEPK